MSTCLVDTFLPTPVARARYSGAMEPAALDNGLVAALRAAASGRHDQIGSSVQAALLAVESRAPVLERRREARYPYPYPIHLTPFGASGQPEVDRTFVVIGKHIAPHGIDFYCRKPVADRRVVASLDCGGEGWIGLVVELAWCRFSRHGWYDNGGRFITVVPSPLLELNDRPRAA
ncbi:MAG TPA: hypothetical protein VKH44_08925 [Pirellulaceae bacterium]|nr:hypothetical protein [Pirellulaceae bacterium]